MTELKKALKPFIGCICLFLALHSTQPYVYFPLATVILNISWQAGVAHTAIGKLIYCPQTYAVLSRWPPFPPGPPSPLFWPHWALAALRKEWPLHSSIPCWCCVLAWLPFSRQTNSLLLSFNFFFLLKIFLFLTWTIFKVLIEFVCYNIASVLFRFFGPEACGVLAPRPGIEPAPAALEGEVLTTGPPGKSPSFNFLSVPTCGKVSQPCSLLPSCSVQIAVMALCRQSPGSGCLILLSFLSSVPWAGAPIPAHRGWG